VLKKAWVERKDVELEKVLPLVYGVVVLFFESSNVVHRPNEDWILIWIPMCLLATSRVNKSIQIESSFDKNN